MATLLLSYPPQITTQYILYKFEIHFDKQIKINSHYFEFLESLLDDYYITFSFILPQCPKHQMV